MTFQNILPVHPLEGVQNWIRHFRADLAERRRAQALYDRTWRELSAMSDRERADISIHRSDIAWIACEAVAMSRKQS
ncbi:DUF1127 domain-containing protein [Roseivivax sp. CAU 1753]